MPVCSKAWLESPREAGIARFFTPLHEEEQHLNLDKGEFVSKNETNRKAEAGVGLGSCEYSSSEEPSAPADLTSLRRQPGWVLPTSGLPEPRAITIPIAQKMFALQISSLRALKTGQESQSLYTSSGEHRASHTLGAQEVNMARCWDCATHTVYHCMCRAKHGTWNPWF